MGHSDATTRGREGFQELVAEIALSQVGILIAYDTTRLTRSSSRRYQLLDLCDRMGRLFADRDGVHDPSSVNDRLLLGLKGQISELELHTIDPRPTAGLLNKAKRGELKVTLPTCLIRNSTGEVVKYPNVEVQDRIRNGTIKIEKKLHHNTVLFPDQPETLLMFRQLRAGKLVVSNFERASTSQIPSRVFGSFHRVWRRTSTASRVDSPRVLQYTEAHQSLEKKMSLDSRILTSSWTMKNQIECHGQLGGLVKRYSWK